MASLDKFLTSISLKSQFDTFLNDMGVKVSFDSFLVEIGAKSSFASFVEACDLQIQFDPVTETSKMNQNQIVNDCFQKFKQFHDLSEVAALLTFKVPKINEDGSCSRVQQFEEQPFSLVEMFKPGQHKLADYVSHDFTRAIWRLGEVCEELKAKVECDWLGIYRLVPNVSGHGYAGLVKCAYRGEPSRAIFPVTAEFAKQSNNSWVALHGRGKLVEDVRTYEGPYYACSQKVLSELCVPILVENCVVGIIDAESFLPRHFSRERILEILKVCYDIGPILESILWLPAFTLDPSPAAEIAAGGEAARN